MSAQDGPYIPADQAEGTYTPSVGCRRPPRHSHDSSECTSVSMRMTVSASIPAAVMSMLILKPLQGRGILENNAVQTMASAGESLAAGVIFTVPAVSSLVFGSTSSGSLRSLSLFSADFWVQCSLLRCVACSLLKKHYPTRGCRMS